MQRSARNPGVVRRGIAALRLCAMTATLAVLGGASPPATGTTPPVVDSDAFLARELARARPASKAASPRVSGILAKMTMGYTVIDTSTAPVSLARRLYAEFEGKACAFADAPIARTRQAAIDGTLSIMVGGTPETFARIEPLLRHLASEVTHCGEAGAGQAVKILNNMILFQTVVGLAEALCIAKANGVDGKILFDTLTKGSADSFALRNHGMKAMLPGVFPERAFSTNYALKDLSYAIQMAEEHGVPALGADVARELMERAKELGFEHEYWPVLIKAIEDGTKK